MVTAAMKLKDVYSVEGNNAICSNMGSHQVKGVRWRQISYNLYVESKIMASGPITSWEIDGETVQTVADFIFLGSKITADGDCSHEIKRRFTPWKESYDQPR